MKTILVLFSIILNSPFTNASDLKKIDVTSDENQHSHSEVTGSTSRTLVEKQVSDTEIDNVIQKLPGVVTRNTSGQGSLTTATSPLSLGSGTTAVSIDEIPIPDPTQLGINLALFPSAFFSSAEVLTPFDIHERLSAIQLPSQGSRIVLNTEGLHGGKTSALGGQLNYGSARTLQVSPVYKSKIKDSDLLIGSSFQSTRGDFSYRNPGSDDHKIRENNDSASGSAIAKYHAPIAQSSSVDLLTMHTRIDRTNPGSIYYPGRDHERDTFHLLGMSYTNTEFMHDSQIHASASATWNRVQNWIDQSTRTDTHTFGAFAQTGLSYRKEDQRYFFNVDDQVEKLSDSSGMYDRNTVGFTPRMTWTLDQFKIMPRARVEYNTHYDWAADGGLSVGYGRESDEISALASYGYQHAYPSIVGLSGYYAGSLQVLSNPSLKRERTSTTMASLLINEGRVRLNQTAFFHSVHDRSVYTSLSFAQAQYQNVPSAHVYGTTSDIHVEILQNLSSRISATYMKAVDQGSGRDFPYKPNIQGFASVDANVTSESSVSVEELWLGKRKINLTDDQSLSPYAQTNIVFNYTFSSVGLMFVRADNLFDQGGFVSSGYPYRGRSYTLGLQIEEL